MVILKMKWWIQNWRGKIKYKKCLSSSQSPQQQKQQLAASYWELPTQAENTRGIYNFLGSPSWHETHWSPTHEYRLKSTKCFHFFSQVMELLAVETNWYCHECLDTPDEAPSFLLVVTEFDFCFWLWSYKWDIYKTDWQVTGLQWNSSVHLSTATL